MRGCGKESPSTFTPGLPNAAETSAFDCLVKLERAAPERFIAKCVEAKCLPAVCQEVTGVCRDLRIEVAEFFSLGANWLHLRVRWLDLNVKSTFLCFTPVDENQRAGHHGQQDY